TCGTSAFCDINGQVAWRSIMAVGGKKKAALPARTNNEIRTIMLQYFYNRNQGATSARGKKGYAIRITDIRKELKAGHELSQQEVISNLNYLLSQGWVEEDRIEKSVPLPTGTVIPQSTSFYKITAAGIDKIDGPGDFTMDKFKGIKIEATGQNIITVGDGNQVNAKYQEAAGALVDLKQALLQSSSITETQKLDVVADIDSIQSQLAKANPNRSVIQGAWETVKKLDRVLGLTDKVGKVAALLAPFLAV
ncbi:MAG: hypothetical protein AAGU11_20820, partial [Syntrophobacteraceae bacterium]